MFYTEAAECVQTIPSSFRRCAKVPTESSGWQRPHPVILRVQEWSFPMLQFVVEKVDFSFDRTLLPLCGVLVLPPTLFCHWSHDLSKNMVEWLWSCSSESDYCWNNPQFRRLLHAGTVHRNTPNIRKTNMKWYSHVNIYLQYNFKNLCNYDM